MLSLDFANTTNVDLRLQLQDLRTRLHNHRAAIAHGRAEANAPANTRQHIQRQAQMPTAERAMRQALARAQAHIVEADRRTGREPPLRGDQTARLFVITDLVAGEVNSWPADALAPNLRARALGGDRADWYALRQAGRERQRRDGRDDDPDLAAALAALTTALRGTELVAIAHAASELRDEVTAALREVTESERLTHARAARRIAEERFAEAEAQLASAVTAAKLAAFEVETARAELERVTGAQPG